METNWQEVTALIASFSLIGAVFYFSTAAIVREEFLKLSKIYLRRDLADEKFRQLDAHLMRIDTDIEPLRRIAVRGKETE